MLVFLVLVPVKEILVLVKEDKGCLVLVGLLLAKFLCHVN